MQSNHEGRELRDALKIRREEGRSGMLKFKPFFQECSEDRRLIQTPVDVGVQTSHLLKYVSFVHHRLRGRGEIETRSGRIEPGRGEGRRQSCC